VLAARRGEYDKLETISDSSRKQDKADNISNVIQLPIFYHFIITYQIIRYNIIFDLWICRILKYDLGIVGMFSLYLVMWMASGVAKVCISDSYKPKNSH